MKKYLSVLLAAILVAVLALPMSALSAFSKVEVVKDASYIAYIDSGKGTASKNLGFYDGYGVGNSQQDDIVEFKDIDFGKNGAKEFKISFSYGGTGTTEIAVYIDSCEKGDPICELAIENTSGWKITEAKEFSKAVKVAGGTHNVYVKFINSNNSGSFSWIQFTEAPAAETAAKTTTTAAKTADPIVLTVIGMAVSGAVVFAGKRKHK